MGTGVGTFLKCPIGPSSTPLTQNMILQVGASLYLLVNIIKRDEHQQFVGDHGIPDEASSELIQKLNENQTVLRIKYFGGKLTGQVKYLVPNYQGGTNSFSSSIDLPSLEQSLPLRYFSLGRKSTQQNLHESHDLEIQNDSSISQNHCYFSYSPSSKGWSVTDGCLAQPHTASSNGTWVFVSEPR